MVVGVEVVVAGVTPANFLGEIQNIVEALGVGLIAVAEALGVVSIMEVAEVVVEAVENWMLIHQPRHRTTYVIQIANVYTICRKRNRMFSK
jgi:hypothetical protein